MFDALNNNCPTIKERVTGPRARKDNPIAVWSNIEETKFFQLRWVLLHVLNINDAKTSAVVTLIGYITSAYV